MEGSERIIHRQQFMLAQRWCPCCDHLIPDLALSQLGEILETILCAQLANQLGELVAVTQQRLAFHSVHRTTNGEGDGNNLWKLCYGVNEIPHEGTRQLFPVNSWRIM